jgi:hypothetical protein
VVCSFVMFCSVILVIRRVGGGFVHHEVSGHALTTDRPLAFAT